MSLDPVLNFAKVTVSTTYDDNDTSIVLTTGHGARLPDPATAGAYNLVWYNDTDYPDPADDPNREIVRCTARTSDTLTVTRGQESVTATDKNTAGKTYKMVLALTKKMIDDIQTGLSGSAWVLDYSPLEAVNGANTVFTVPVNASRVIVYADGGRVKGAGLDYTFSSNTTITFVAGHQPFSSLSVDYLPA